MMMYLERENLLSKEQEKDVLDIWKKSINEFPDVRLNLLSKYCNENNCDILAAKDLLYCYLQSDYTCVVNDRYYYFCSDVIMDNDFFLKDEQCQNKTNFEYILKNNPYRYGSVINNDFSEFDFDNFLYELLNDRIYIMFDKKLTSFKDEEEMVNVYFEYCSKIADLFLEEEYYDIKERKIDVSDIEKKMKFPIYIEKISREKIEEDLNFLDKVEEDIDDEKLICDNNSNNSSKDQSLEKENNTSNCYRDFINIFSDKGHLTTAFIYIAYKNNLIDNIFKDRMFDEDIFINNLKKNLCDYGNNDLKYVENKNLMSIIDEIDNKLTICNDYRLKEKNVIEIINDFYITSTSLKDIQTKESEKYVLLNEICYDYDYLMSTEDGIEMYIYQMVNHVFEPFLHELLLLFKKHDIDIFAIQRKEKKFIFDEDEYESYQTENSKNELPKRDSVKTKFTDKQIIEIYRKLNPIYIECDKESFLAFYGKETDKGKIIKWKGKKNEFEIFIRQTVEKEINVKRIEGYPRTKINKWFVGEDDLVIKEQKKFSIDIKVYTIYKEVFKNLSTI